MALQTSKPIIAGESREVAPATPQPDRAIRRADSLRRVIELISGELSLESLLTRIIESASELTGAQYGTIGLVESRDEGPIVRTAAVVNMPPLELGMEFRPGVGLSGRVLRDRQPVVLQRYGDLEAPTIGQYADHAVIGMPIWWGERMLGTFGLGADPPHHFDAYDVETLALFARHAAIAIENARRFEREQRRSERFELIARIARVITADLRLSDVLQNAATAIHDLLGYRYVAIPLLDPNDSETLVLRTVGGDWPPLHESEYRLPVSHGVIGAAVRSRQVVLINDVRRDGRYLPIPGLENIVAELAAPILRGEQVLGAINVESDRPFSADDADSLRIIADQLAVAIDKARLFESEQRRVARIAAINHVSQLVTGSLDIDTILQTTVEAIRDHLQFTTIGVLLIAPDHSETLVMRAWTGAFDAAVRGEYRQRIEDGIIGLAARTHERVLINDAQHHEHYLQLPGLDNMYGAAAVPIVVGDRLLGVLSVESTGPIEEEDAFGFEIIADQLGIAIENARSYAAERQRTERLQLIARVGQRIAARLDPDELFQTTVEELHERLGYDHAAVFLLDPDDPDWLVKRTTASHWPGNPPGHRQHVSRGIMGAAARERRPVLINDVWNDSRYVPVPGATTMCAEIAVPIVVDDRLIGVVDLGSAHRLRDEDVTGAQIIAGQLAVAIDNAQLLDRGRQLAVLDERRRLARELHDSVTQSLFGMSLLAQTLPDLWQVDRDAAAESLEQIRDLTRSSLAEMRALLFELRPAEHADQTLCGRLRRHIAAFEQRTGIAVASDLSEPRGLPDPVTHALARIAQEALANIARHAGAHHVRLMLSGEHPLRLSIADDGRGFDPSGVGAGHFGLISMRERAAEIGARLMIHSTIGGGTMIAVEWSRESTPPSEDDSWIDCVS